MNIFIGVFNIIFTATCIFGIVEMLKQIVEMKKYLKNWNFSFQTHAKFHEETFWENFESSRKVLDKFIEKLYNIIEQYIKEVNSMTIKFCYKFNTIEDSKDISKMTNDEVQEWIANVGSHYKALISVTDDICQELNISLDDKKNVATMTKKEPKNVVKKAYKKESEEKPISPKQYEVLSNYGYEDWQLEDMTSKTAWKIIKNLNETFRYDD